MRALHVLNDRIVHGVAGDADRSAVDDAGQRDDGDVGRAAADIDDHVPGCLGHRQPGADRSGHRLVDEMDFSRLGPVGAVLDGAPLHRRDLGRHADDDPRADPRPQAAMRFFHEVGQHLLGGVEVGDHAAADRPHRPDVRRRASDHVAGAQADGFDRPGRGVQRHDRRLVDDDAAAAREDAGVGGTKINCQIAAEAGHTHGALPYSGWS